tara:strand:+ start:1159 stop:1617 length:459 start_codon:yes stop_codon:yes gene_type:complete
MTLKDNINSRFQSALKNKDKNLISTLRLMIAAIKDGEIAKRKGDKKDITDNDIITILRKMIKQRKESSDIYKKAGRNELFQKEYEEVLIIESFLPKQMNDEQMEQLCKKTILETGALSNKDLGKVIGILKKNHGNDLDFAKVGIFLKNELNT